MTHIFIINPMAGKGNATVWLSERISAAFSDAPELCEVYITQGAGDATTFTRRRCEARQGNEDFCFYGCGGDGTAREVAEGIQPYPFACLGVVPCGTGNDFVKNFPDRDFLDFASQRNGSSGCIDLVTCNGQCCINICNVGMDANVARDIVVFKRLPLMGGTTAYIVSLCKNFFGRLGEFGQVSLDGNALPSQNLLLLLIANGRYYGGSFLGAPEAAVDDGLLDVSIVPKLSRPRILSVLPRYKKGLHTTDPELKKLVTYRKCRQITVEYDQPVTVCVDGESSVASRVEAKILPGALRLWLPAPVGASVVPAHTAHDTVTA